MQTERKPYEHDYNNFGKCKKCKRFIKEELSKVCPVIGKEEVAGFRDTEIF